MNDLYLTYAKQKRIQYGEKVYKLPVNLIATCPNRDGTKGVGGCIFCGEKGTGFENLSNQIPVKEQLEINKAYIGPKYKAKKFVAYFQNFTNTYFPPEVMYAYAKQAAEVEGVVELCFATRPDCVEEEILTAIQAGAGDKRVCIELGLQSVNDDTLLKINRGHTVAQYVEAVRRIQDFGFDVGTHLILNLPWDSRQDCIDAAILVSRLGIDTVKIHTLYIEKGTVLCDMYESGKITICSKAEYIRRAADFLEHLKPDISLQRLASRVPNGDTIFCNWGTGWWKLRDLIEDEMRRRGSVQGIKCNDSGKKEDILILWDIDGTLMSCGGDGTRALNELFRRRTGVKNALGEIKVGTAMDSMIFDNLLNHFQIPKEERDALILSFAEILKDILDRNESKRVLPGILEILDTLRTRDGVYMGLLTSNFKIGADLKLDSVGLKGYFTFGGYGDTYGEKWHAAELAVETAESISGSLFMKDNIYLIGDTWYDIQCARKMGIKSISVATGWADAETLKSADPDYFFYDLSDPQAFYRVIFGNASDEEVRK